MNTQATTIASTRGADGVSFRLQRRRGKFDVISNRTGFSWRYLVKGVSESAARSVFNLQTMTESKGDL